MHDTMQKMRALARVQTVLARIELRVRGTQGAVFVVAMVMALLCLAMLNIAGFLALSSRIGHTWSALVFGIVDAVLAAILVSVAKKIQPGPEVESATEVRDLILDGLSSDAEALKDELVQARADVRRIRNGFSALTGGVKGLGSVVDLLTGALKGSKKKKDKSE